MVWCGVMISRTKRRSENLIIMTYTLNNAGHIYTIILLLYIRIYVYIYTYTGIPPVSQGSVVGSTEFVVTSIPQLEIPRARSNVLRFLGINIIESTHIMIHGFFGWMHFQPLTGCWLGEFFFFLSPIWCYRSKWQSGLRKTSADLHLSKMERLQVFFRSKPNYQSMPRIKPWKKPSPNEKGKSTTFWCFDFFQLLNHLPNNPPSPKDTYSLQANLKLGLPQQKIYSQHLTHLQSPPQRTWHTWNIAASVLPPLGLPVWQFPVLPRRRALLGWLLEVQFIEELLVDFVGNTNFLWVGFQ